MKARARWVGPLPALGDFFRSQRRPRYAYQVVDIQVSRAAAPLDPACSTCFYPDPSREDHQGLDRLICPIHVTVAMFTLDRHALHEVPPDATIHPWTWDPRGRKKGPIR